MVPIISDYCPNCGRLNAYTNDYCEVCGAQLPWSHIQRRTVTQQLYTDEQTAHLRDLQKQTSTWAGLLGLLFMVFGLLCTFWFGLDGLSGRSASMPQLALFPDWRVGFGLSLLCVIIGGVFMAYDRKLKENE